MAAPHTAIREDASINLAAVSDIVRKWPKLEIVFVESGGDNLAATFSPELADITIYVIDVAAGEKIPRKGGPGITRSDLLVINKIDLAPLVGANLDVMDRDARKMRGQRPFLFSNLKENKGGRRYRGLRRTTGRPAGASSHLKRSNRSGVPMTRIVSLIVLLCAAATPALAHPGHDTSGFAHPFTGWDHLLAMVGVGLWASLLSAKRPAAAYLVPSAFVVMMLLGAAAGSRRHKTASR